MLGYAIFKDGKSAKLPYPLENFLSDVAGRSFHIGPANSAGWYPNLFCQLGAGELQPSVSKSWTWSTEIRCVVDVPGQKVPSVSDGEMAPCLKLTKAPQTWACQLSPMGDAFNWGRNDCGSITHCATTWSSSTSTQWYIFLCKYPQSFYSLGKQVAPTISTLAGALYKVFRASPDHPARNEMCQACFDYMSLEGVFSNGLIALLSGLDPRPLSSVLHFFAVAIYGVGRLKLPFKSSLHCAFPLM